MWSDARAVIRIQLFEAIAKRKDFFQFGYDALLLGERGKG